MKVRTYHHLFVRVDYPQERGYRLEPKQLPDWLHVTIEETEDSKQLIVHSKIHTNKSVRVGPQYSSTYSDRDLLIELSAEVSKRFL